MATTPELTRAFRRVVTGHDADGRAVILSDSPPNRVRQVGGPGGPTFFEVWNTRETPAVIDRQSVEPEESSLVLAPPKGGTRIRVIEFPPEGDAVRRLTAAEAAEKFSEMGGSEAARSRADAPHPLMHRTQTLDYGIVLEGELTLVVDRGETTVRAGDIIIQRGTNHAWANRSDKICRVAFVLIDGRFVDGL
jgi:mannose-6-phosphate isomerase-like protein (cupin superfamily)